MFGREFTECTLKDLKFKDLTEEDQEILVAHARRRPSEWACILGAAAIALFLIVYAWLLNDNGIAYKLTITVLGLVLFGVSWLFAGNPKIKARGSIRGEIESSHYVMTSAGDNANQVVDYLATINFNSSKQKIIDQKVPGAKEHKTKLTAQEHCPPEGTEILVLKISSKKYMLILPKYAKKQRRFYVKM